MKIKGINYNTGYKDGSFDITLDEIEKQLTIIKKDLNANSIGILGSDTKHIIEVSKLALEMGLNIWVKPRYVNKTVKETIPLLIELSKATDILREEFDKKEVIFVVATELSLDAKGIFEGDSYMDRIETASSYWKEVKTPDKRQGYWAVTEDEQNNLSLALKKIVEAVKENFKGKITYAAGNWEKVDWSLFDIVSDNLYLSRHMSADDYFKILLKLKEHNKPVVLTEFGTASCDGATISGADAWIEVMDNPDIDVNEKEQVKGIKIQLDLIKKSDIDGCFVWTFFEPNPKTFGITKFENGNIVPKKAFHTISKFYKGWG